MKGVAFTFKSAIYVKYLLILLFFNENGRGRCCGEEIKKVIKPAVW